MFWLQLLCWLGPCLFPEHCLPQRPFTLARHTRPAWEPGAWNDQLHLADWRAGTWAT